MLGGQGKGMICLKSISNFVFIIRLKSINRPISITFSHKMTRWKETLGFVSNFLSLQSPPARLPHFEQLRKKVKVQSKYDMIWYDMTLIYDYYMFQTKCNCFRKISLNQFFDSLYLNWSIEGFCFRAAPFSICKILLRKHLQPRHQI